MYIEHLRIPVGAGALHVERVGRAGKPIVLLHGFGTSAFLWRAVLPLLAAKGFTALAIDLLGHGESDRPIDGAYRISAQAEHIDLALTALRMPKAVIVGQDIGAVVALQLAARRPERVDRLVLINPSDPADLPGPTVRALQRASARIALGAHGLFGAGPLLTPMLREAVADEQHMTDVLAARYLASFVGSDGVDHLLMLARSLEFEDGDELALWSIRAPTLLLHGLRDKDTDATMLGTLAASLSGVRELRMHAFEHAGKLVPEDAPGELSAVIAEWANVSWAESVE
ncbi:MAG: alpha/beta hydrolase [Gemmatimonadota bacterium]|nr:alpha/beta hydrolase [Gemmatimonadota bacterium]